MWNLLLMHRRRRVGATLLARPAGEPLWEAISNAVLAHYEGTGQALVEAIAARTGTDLEQDMYPRILAGAVIAAAQVRSGVVRRGGGPARGARRRVNEEEFKVPAGPRD